MPALSSIDSTRLIPVPAKQGRPRREDYECVRGGARNLFLTYEPLAGWRHVEITERRTKADFAWQMRWLAEEAYPEAEVIRVVLDNLNTHRKASLYGYSRRVLVLNKIEATEDKTGLGRVS